MRRLALLAGILVCSAGAFGQAMAEGALTHALSTATGTAMGKALGTATNQMTTRVAGRLGQQTSNAVPRSRVQTVKPGVPKPGVPASGTTAEPPSGGSLIASIQGAAPQETTTTCAQVIQTPSAASPANAQVVPEQKQSNCPAKGSEPAGAKDQPANSYKSVITLPAAK